MLAVSHTHRAGLNACNINFQIEHDVNSCTTKNTIPLSQLDKTSVQRLGPSLLTLTT